MRYRFSQSDIAVRRNDVGSLVLSVMLDGQRIERTYMFYSLKEAIKKFQQEFGTYPKNFKPVGVLALNNFGGLAVMEIEHGIDDYVYVAANYGDGYTRCTRNKIRYNKKGEAYFIRNGHTFYLKEFMRC